MEIEDQVKDLLRDIEIAENAHKKKNFPELHDALFRINPNILKLRKLLYASADREVKKFSNYPIFDNFFTFFTKDFSKLTEREVHRDETTYFEIFVEELLPMLNELKGALEKILSLLKNEEGINVVHDEKYQRNLRKNAYKENIIIIRRVEQKIIDFFASGQSPGRSVLARIDKDSRRRKKNIFHAWLPYPLDNHRIFYRYDAKEKTIVFIDIGTHKELGLGYSG